MTLTLLEGLYFSGHAAEPERVTSPDQRLVVQVQMPAPNSTERPKWSLTFAGHAVVAGALGLQTTHGDLMRGVEALERRRSSIDERIPVLFGKADHAFNRYHEVRYRLQTKAGQRADVVFRCFNDALAFRYELPGSDTPRTVTIADETTSFEPAGDPTAFVQYLENYKTSHEHTVARVPFSEVRPGWLLDMPLTLQWTNGLWAAISEAALRNYAGMSLARPTDARAQLVCKLTPRPDGTKVVRPLPILTPWRVVLVADRPGALLESETLYALNEPSRVADASWINPGKITFHWWNGDVYDGEPGESILSFNMAKKYIDFCARNGLPTHSLSSTEVILNPWYQQSTPGVAPGPDTDVTRPRPGFELERIHQYAQAQGVRLWTWVHQAALKGRVEEAFAAFERLGWSGMMVDFFDHDDQESVEFSEAILEAAARHRIMIHFHGIWKPTGLERTYPNLMNHEGALNLEYLKWSNTCTPEHNLSMAFTRLIAGPMDYHLGGFRARTRAQFEARPVAPYVLGTRGHMLAMYVCFDNPNPMLADYPTAYEGQPGFDFLKRVPTWWDATRVLQGEPGALLVTARRKGSTWYLGGMSAGPARGLGVPLRFLESGDYIARIWKDAAGAESDPNLLTTETGRLAPSDILQVRLATDGGFVAELSPAP